MERIRVALDKARKERRVIQRPLVRGEDGVTTIGPPGTARQGDFKIALTTILEPDPAHLAQARILTPDASADAVDIFRMLRTQVLQRMAERGARTLAVCSPGDGEGKTVTAVNLAISMAAAGKQTALLVDLNLRAPGVAACFGVPLERGLDTYLAGEADLGQCLFNPGIDRLIVLPTLAPVELSSETIASARMRALASELRARYADRIIIYDTPDLTTSDDCLMFADQLDAYLLVIEEGRTTRDAVRRAIELLGTEKLLGSILNSTGA